MIDSGISLCGQKSNHDHRTKSIPGEDTQYCEPIHMTFEFGDVVHTKSLDYETFAQWDAMEAFTRDLEADGIVVEELWDDTEGLKVSSGDWDARVRPGWEIKASLLEAPVWIARYEDDIDSDSEGYESGDEEEWIDEYIDKYLDGEVEDWCLPRWRSRVEQKTLMAGRSREPSRMVLALGCASMVFFVVAVIVYTA